MTKAPDLYAIALRFRELARTEASGLLRKRLLDWALRCDKMAKALEAEVARQRRREIEENAAEPA